MRAIVIGLLISFGSVSFAQSVQGDLFVAIGRRLNMSAGSVRAMLKREGLLAPVESFFPKTVVVDSDQLVAGEDASALVKLVLNGGPTVQRHAVDLPADVDPDQMLLATLLSPGKSIQVVCVAILPGRSDARRSRLLDTPARNKMADATAASDDDEVLAQVRRMIKEMRTSDYVCHAS